MTAPSTARATGPRRRDARASITIRPVTQADRAAWARLWRGYNAFYERTIAAAVTARTWSRFLDAAEPMHALVAQRGDRLVGLAHYVFHRSTSLMGPTCYLQDLFTEASARRSGVGRALIEAVYASARAGGARRVYWHTHRGNATAIRLYDAVARDTGFIVYGKDLPG